MNCDKKFLGCCRLEAGGYLLGLIHAGASVAVMVLYLNHLDRIDLSVWILTCGFIFWCFHFAASVLLVVGTAKRKSTFIVPFIILYTMIFTSIATFAAFCVLEGVASEPRASRKTSNVVNNSTEAMKKKMKAFKANFIPKLTLSGVNYAVLMLVVGLVCLLCVYILSCICSLYDHVKLKDEGKCLPLIGSTEYGAVRESESDE